MTPHWWEPSVDFLSQSAHVGWGAYLSLFGCFIVGPWITLAILVPIAAVKEFGIDTWLEPDTWMGSLLDFSFYCFGIAGGLASYWFVTAGGA